MWSRVGGNLYGSKVDCRYQYICAGREEGVVLYICREGFVSSELLGGATSLGHEA